MSKTRTPFFLSGLGLALAAVLLVLALSAGSAGAEPAVPTVSDHLITNIALSPATPNFVRLGEDVTVSFDYQTVELGGVRILARPFTGGSLSPGYLAGSSPLYAVGSGSGSNGFTINGGPAVVDEIRLRMFNADQSVLLFEAFIPVHFAFTDAANPLFNFEFSPATPNVMLNGNQVDTTFDYQHGQLGGARIFLLPFTGGSPTSGYAVSGSPLYPTGLGSGSGYFQVNSGEAVIDQVRGRMTNNAQTILLFQGFLPVHYQYDAGPNRVYNLALTPQTPNILDLTENVNLTFDYTTNHLGGVRILARPMKDGALAPDSSSHSSPVYPTGGGNGSGFFTMIGDPLVVDGIRLRMVNSDQTLLLFETVVPVHYKFGTVAQENVINLPVILDQSGG